MYIFTNANSNYMHVQISSSYVCELFSSGFLIEVFFFKMLAAQALLQDDANEGDINR